MAPARKIQPGDWLVHSAFQRRNTVKRAEIVTFFSGSKVGLYLDGEPGMHTITCADITRWWELFIPPAAEPNPFYVKPGATFVTAGGEYTAVIREAHPGWVSFLETSEKFGAVFRIKPYDDFAPHWAPLRRPSVWEWLRQPGV